ncbi:RNA polymerase sigma factor [Reichenbachiella ulvae]|uniref:RNA polymerase sigma factor n=1 Tax=Reichenbachiella ulvae TaxID=2980104 RepID=A0ABT3CTW8_9BACT|nr:RNA polymerase sigma factor [Reichenbachiella ulvae]MCV9386925.1 RNA polymerase sigma factor [Reichenbachiella ulvae]
MKQATSHKDIHYEWVELLRVNDRTAQYEIYRLYSKAMLNTSFRMLQDLAEAEDVVQEAFVKAFNGIDKFRGESTFGSWLKRIVVNGALNVIKKRKEMADVDEIEDRPDADESLDYSEVSVDQVKAAVADLPEGFRMVFTLYLIEGYDHKEIAEILGISESTSKSQFNRAKAKLKVILKNRYNYER